MRNVSSCDAASLNPANAPTLRPQFKLHQRLELPVYTVYSYAAYGYKNAENPHSKQ